MHVRRIGLPLDILGGVCMLFVCLCTVVCMFVCDGLVCQSFGVLCEACHISINCVCVLPSNARKLFFVGGYAVS